MDEALAGELSNGKEMWNVFIAQLDRASRYEREGRGFKSLWGHIGRLQT